MKIIYSGAVWGIGVGINPPAVVWRSCGRTELGWLCGENYRNSGVFADIQRSISMCEYPTLHCAGCRLGRKTARIYLDCDEMMVMEGFVL